MKNLFIPYELAYLSKQKGFTDENCFADYLNSSKQLILRHVLNNEIWKKSILIDKNSIYLAAPLYQQIVDWLRISHKLAIEIQLYCGEYSIIFNKVTKNTNRSQSYQMFKIPTINGVFDYYQAFDLAIHTALKSITKK